MTLKIYIGYDSREDIAYRCCEASILEHASLPVEIYPLKQPTLREVGLYNRGEDNASTEFSLTRFLAPYLAAFDGWSVFVDCDFIFTVDIYKLLNFTNSNKAVFVVKHDYTPRQSIKMDSQKQTTYPRKNWSSFIAFNGAHPDVKALTPEVVNSESPAFLHRFSWVRDDDSIGELPLTWNFLVGEYDAPDTVPHAIHYTNGGPWFANCRNVDYADVWLAQRERVEAGASSTQTLQARRAQD